MTPKRPGAVAIRQARCSVCTDRPVAMRGVEFCFGCWPGGPVTPPPCLRCGATTGYYTSGICRRCHPDGNPGVDSCLECFAWGATRTCQWLCRGCLTFRRHNPTVSTCPVCDRNMNLGKWGVCRLCYKQAGFMRERHGRLDPVEANRYGQQLFFADMFLRRGMRRKAIEPTVDSPDDATPPRNQLVLFEARRDLAAHGRAGLQERADPVLAARLEQHATVMAAELGWTPRQVKDTCFGIRIVLGIRDDDGPVKASTVELLRDIDLPVWTVLRVLAEAQLLEDDRVSTFETWVTQQLGELPEPMAAELNAWFQIMRNGSPIPPRRRPRSEITIGLHLRWALPILRAWAAIGHTSLREITKEHILDALPPSGDARARAGQGLRSICRLLKARRVLFVDPTSRVKTGQHRSREPLPANLDLLRAALHSENPAQAAVAALIAFHGLRVGQLQRLHLTDIRDGRLHLDGRVIVLAEPVRERISRYLDHRAQRWPNTSNAHLFLHFRSATRTDPVGKRWIWLTLGPGLSPTAVREDRILDEAHATQGDVRRLSDLFGLSIKAGTRYTATVDHPDLIHIDDDH